MSWFSIDLSESQDPQKCQSTHRNCQFEVLCTAQYLYFGCIYCVEVLIRVFALFYHPVDLYILTHRQLRIIDPPTRNQGSEKADFEGSVLVLINRHLTLLLYDHAVLVWLIQINVLHKIPNLHKKPRFIAGISR